MGAQGDTDNAAIDQRAFDYAWNYFALHAGQRMQAVNFFLVATTFLATAYVTALVGSYAGLAAGIAILGVLSSIIFYRIERRVRTLIHAAEAALRPFEDLLASELQNPSLKILERVQTATGDAWSYGTVFRRLYMAVGFAFGTGATYGVLAQLGYTPNTTHLFPLILRLAAGVILLIFAFETTVAQRPRDGYVAASTMDRARVWAGVIAGFLAALAGVILLVGLGVAKTP